MQLKHQRQEIGRLQRDENRLTKLLENLTQIVAEPAKAALSQNRQPTIEPIR